MKEIKSKNWKNKLTETIWYMNQEKARMILEDSEQ